MYLALLLLLAFSAFFSASATALSSVNRIRLKNKADDGDKKAQDVYKRQAFCHRFCRSVCSSRRATSVSPGTMAQASRSISGVGGSMSCLLYTSRCV